MLELRNNLTSELLFQNEIINFSLNPTDFNLHINFNITYTLSFGFYSEVKRILLYLHAYKAKIVLKNKIISITIQLYAIWFFFFAQQYLVTNLGIKLLFVYKIDDSECQWNVLFVKKNWNCISMSL